MKMRKGSAFARALKRSHGNLARAWSMVRSGGGGKRRKNGRRRSRGRRSRNPLIATLSNPLPNVGNLVRKIPVVGPRLAGAVSPDNVKKGAAVGATIGVAFLAPIALAKKGYISSEYTMGWKGLVATGLAGVAAASGIGMLSPSSAPAALGAALGAVVLQVILEQSKSYLGISGMGQVPAGIIQGGGAVGDFLTLGKKNGMGDFFTTTRPFAALPGGGLASGQRFSKAF